MPSDSHRSKRRKTTKSTMQNKTHCMTKASDEWRRLIRQQASTLKYDVWALYQTLVGLAGPDVVLELASLIPLPESTYEEDEALDGGGKIPGYDGVNTVDKPCWKSREKATCEVVAPFKAHDLPLKELYSPEHLLQPMSVRKRKPALLALFGKPPEVSGRKRAYADDTGDDDTDVDCDEEEEGGEEREEEKGKAEEDIDAMVHEAAHENLVKFNPAFFNGEPVSGKELLELFFVHMGAGETCKALDRTLKARRAVRKFRWRSRKRIHCRVSGTQPAKKSKLSQCWLASDVEEEEEEDDDESDDEDREAGNEEERRQRRAELMEKIEIVLHCKHANADGGEGFWDTVQELIDG